MPPSGLTIALAAHAGDNTINADEAAAGFATTGTTGDLADGQIVIGIIVNRLSAVAYTYTTTFSGNASSLIVTAAQAMARWGERVGCRRQPSSPGDREPSTHYRRSASRDSSWG